ncbi:MAG TPA: hypothetical protein VF288_10700 [Mycobacteriales bacterium]
MNPVEVDAKILELCDLLERQAGESAALAVKAAESEARYRRAVATTQLRVRSEMSSEKPTEGRVDAEVTVRVSGLLAERLIAEAKSTSARDVMFATRARIDALRTIAASMREAARG